MVRLRMWFVVLGALLGVGCGFPPPVSTPGYPSLQRGRRGQVDLEARGRWHLGMNAGGALHVEPYVSRRLSIPVTVGGGLASGFQARAGMRYRILDILTVGGGVGGSMYYLSKTPVDYYFGTPSGDASLIPRYISGTVDFELAVGARRKWFHGGMAIRPSFSVFRHREMEHPWIHAYLGLDLFMGFYITPKVAVTWHIDFGVGSDPTGFRWLDPFSDEPGLPVVIVFGTSLGVVVHL